MLGKLMMAVTQFDDCESTIRFRLMRILMYPYLRMRIDKFDARSYIHPTVSIQNFGKIHLGANVIINRSSIVWGELSTGHDVSIGPNNYIYGKVEMGSYVMSGPGCMFASGNHGFEDTKVPMMFQSCYSKGPIVIEDDVWIGANSVILDGVKIGCGSIVGAGSVVAKNVAPYSIVAGNPARFLRKRKNGAAAKC